MIRLIFFALAVAFLIPATSTVAEASDTTDRYNRENQARDAQRQRDADRANRERDRQQQQQDQKRK